MPTGYQAKAAGETIHNQARSIVCIMLFNLKTGSAAVLISKNRSFGRTSSKENLAYSDIKKLPPTIQNTGKRQVAMITES